MFYTLNASAILSPPEQSGRTEDDMANEATPTLKPGDKIVCVDADASFHRLHLGGTYTVRQFWRDGDHLVSAVLDWVSHEGFQEYMHHRFGEDFGSSHEFRQRFLLQIDDIFERMLAADNRANQFQTLRFRKNQERAP